MEGWWKECYGAIVGSFGDHNTVSETKLFVKKSTSHFRIFDLNATPGRSTDQ